MASKRQRASVDSSGSTAVQSAAKKVNVVDSGLWLMKSDDDFPLSELKQCPNQTRMWDGVRGAQVRFLFFELSFNRLTSYLGSQLHKANESR